MATAAGNAAAADDKPAGASSASSKETLMIQAFIQSPGKLAGARQNHSFALPLGSVQEWQTLPTGTKLGQVLLQHFPKNWSNRPEHLVLKSFELSSQALTAHGYPLLVDHDQRVVWYSKTGEDGDWHVLDQKQPTANETQQQQQQQQQRHYLQPDPKRVRPFHVPLMLHAGTSTLVLSFGKEDVKFSVPIVPPNCEECPWSLVHPSIQKPNATSVEFANTTVSGTEFVYAQACEVLEPVSVERRKRPQESKKEQQQQQTQPTNADAAAVATAEYTIKPIHDPEERLQNSTQLMIGSTTHPMVLVLTIEQQLVHNKQATTDSWHALSMNVDRWWCMTHLAMVADPLWLEHVVKNMTPTSQSIYTRDIKRCSTCTQPTQQKCGRCQTAYYCSRECQARQWKQHKPMCMQLRTLAKK